MNRKANIIFMEIIFLVSLSLFGVTNGRYVLNRAFGINSSSIPFYFDAEANSEEVIIEDVNGIVSITVKNYIDSKRITSKDLSYKIELSEDDEDKFEISNLNTKDLPAGVKTDEVVEFAITPKENANLKQTELITIIVTSTSPYKKVIKIPIIVYVDVYKVSYEIYFENDDIWIRTDEDEYDGITLDSVFGADRAKIVINGNYSFNVNIPSKYTGDTYNRVGANYNKLSYMIIDKSGNELDKNGNCPDYKDTWGEDGVCPLGAELVYKDGTNDVDTTKGPSVYLLSATYYNNNVTENREIVVKLNEKYVKGEDEKPIEKPVFDARYALSTINLNGRGASGSYNSDSETNIKNEDPGWSWGSFYRETKEMKYDEETDSYSFTWVFQTNSNAGGWGWLLNSLELNGVGLTIPFIPCLGVGMSGSLNGIEHPIKTSDFRIDGTREIDQDTCAASRKTTILPDGAQATIKYIKIFGTQRVYELEITGAHSSVVVTYGNLNMYGTGAAEAVIYSITGVDEDNIYDGAGNKVKKSSVLVKPELFQNVRFKLLPHYENPSYELTNVHGDPLEGGTISYDEGTGMWNIIGLPRFGEGTLINYKIGLLTITGKPIRYAIRYLPGDIENAEFATWFDDNNGKYYTIENTSVVNIFNERPIDSDGNKVFRNWTVNNTDNVINRGQVITLNYIFENSVVDNDGVYVLELLANWE